MHNNIQYYIEPCDNNNNNAFYGSIMSDTYTNNNPFIFISFFI